MGKVTQLEPLKVAILSEFIRAMNRNPGKYAYDPEVSFQKRAERIVYDLLHEISWSRHTMIRYDNAGKESVIYPYSIASGLVRTLVDEEKNDPTAPAERIAAKIFAIFKRWNIGFIASKFPSYSSKERTTAVVYPYPIKRST